MVVAESKGGYGWCSSMGVRMWKWSGGTEQSSVSSENVGRSVVVGRPVIVGRPETVGRLVPGQFRARGELIGFVVEGQNLGKIGRICGWKWWR